MNKVLIGAGIAAAAVLAVGYFVWRNKEHLTKLRKDYMDADLSDELADIITEDL